MKLHCRIAILVFIFSSFVVKSTISQNYVEIGTGVIENTMPIYSSWNYSWSDLVYNHTDLGAAKTITKIGLNCTNGPKTVTNQKMYVKLSSNTIYATAGFEDPISNGYTLVYDGSLTFVNGWNEIILTSPIVYDGVQNILIHWENRWGTSYGPKFLSSASTINNNKNCGNDATFPLPGQNGYLNPYPSSLTNMRFYYTSSGPATPTNPVPADNAIVVSVDTDLSWTLGANTTNYDLYFGTDPLNLPLVVNNAAAIAGINTYTVPGLLSDSAMHYWRVIAKNGSQQEPSPIWKFKTEVVIDQFPYYEGFEDSLVFHTYPVTSAWVISPDVSWYEYNVNPHSGLLCAKSSFYNSSNSAVLRSPKVILPAGYSISYFWRNTSANKVAAHDTTYAEVSVNGGITWLKIDTLAPLTQNASYIQRTHNLNSYAGNNFYFRFRHTTDNSGSACNVYLDDISIFQSGAAATLAVTPSNQDVSSAAGSALFAVTSNSAWTVTSDQSWCTVTPSGSGNGNITASYTENASGVHRLAHITISVSGLSPVVVTLTQGISVATLSVTPPNQSVTAPAGSTNFAVSSGTSWTAVSNQTWCTVTPSGSGNGTLTATYAENSGFASRIANITVSASGSSPVLVTVTQEAALPYLAVTPGNQDAGSPAGTTNFSVSSNLSWTALSDAGWCVVTAAGTGT
ncbi:MAG: BACON domain-containing carbohydrate-binding protein, partial [Bacteroidota bacterium]